MIKTKKNIKFITKGEDGVENGFLVPIYNVNDGFHDSDKQPQQVYLTVVKPRQKKGPHLHFIRTGFFTCIKGNVRIITKEDNVYSQFFSGESNNFLSTIIPTGVPAILENIGNEDAYVINLPSPAWTPDMNDEHSADFSDCPFIN
jgi:dTDP-4-dehydrorhamnose 3,5-epimerase